MKSNVKGQISFTIVLLTLAIQEAVPHYLHLRPNRTVLSKNSLKLGENRYEEVSLVQPKFKSKKLAGLESSVFRTDSSSGQTRHLEWLTGSDDDPESATPTDKGFFQGLLDMEEDEGDKKTQATAPDILRQHNNRRKYVKVDKMIFPLLLAYKLKFFTLVPLLIGALILLVGSTGLAGFFFALFAAAAGLNHHKGSYG